MRKSIGSRSEGREERTEGMPAADQRGRDRERRRSIGIILGVRTERTEGGEATERISELFNTPPYLPIFEDVLETVGRPLV